MLGSAFGAHPQILMHGELFGAHHFPLNFYGVDEGMPWPTPIEILLKKARDKDCCKFLDDLVFADTALSRIGFKFKFEEFGLWPRVVEYIKQKKLQILFLRRSDLLDRYLSEIEALYSGLFNTTDRTMYGTIAQSDISDKLLVKEMARSLDRSIRNHTIFSETFTGNDVLSLTYENLRWDWPNELRKICRFLNIDELELKPTSEKLSGEKIVSKICNIERSRAELIELGYEKYLQK